MRLGLFVLLLEVCIFPAWGQLAQSNPEYCGLQGGASPPLADVSASVNPAASHRVTLYVDRGNGAIAIPLEESSQVSEILQICPLADGRLVVFGDIRGASAVYVVDKATASGLDFFYAFRPVMSPDQRWIAYGKFFPLHGVEGSDQLMIYDLRKTPKQNRPIDAPDEVGMAVFPPGHQNYTGSNIDLPEGLRHLGSGRLYWSSDSRAILFEDSTKAGPGIALVLLDEKGTPTAFRHALTEAEICGRDVPGARPGMWWLDRAEIGPNLAGERTIWADVNPSGDGRCAPHVLKLHKEAFQPAKTEVNVRPTYTHGVIKDGKVISPPKVNK